MENTKIDQAMKFIAENPGKTTSQIFAGVASLENSNDASKVLYHLIKKGLVTREQVPNQDAGKYRGAHPYTFSYFIAASATPPAGETGRQAGSVEQPRQRKASASLSSGADSVTVEKPASAAHSSSAGGSVSSGPHRWGYPGESRIDIIGQNGNEGLHYAQDQSNDLVSGKTPATSETGCTNAPAGMPGEGQACQHDDDLIPICRSCLHSAEDPASDPESVCCECRPLSPTKSKWEPKKQTTEQSSAVDMVNNPPHYTQGGIECIDAIRAALTEEEWRGYCKGNALKYIWRERHKGGDESLRKAEWYMDRLIGVER